MASLTGSTIASTYTGLLKTSDSGARGAEGSADQCSDGAGNTIPLFVSATEVYAIGSGTGTSHTAFGKDCGVDLAAGTGNSLFGEGAGADISTGEHNVAVGYHALFQGTTETDDCVAIGYNAMSGAITTQVVNDVVAIGSGAIAGAAEDEVSGSVAIGTSALAAVTTGQYNLAVGYNAMVQHTTGGSNMAIGYGAMDGTQAGGTQSTSAGSTDNIFIGKNSGGGAWADAASNSNTAVGNNTLAAVMNAVSDSVAIGSNALGKATQGDANVGVGFAAGYNNLTGGHNVFMGQWCGGQATDVDDTVCIGGYAGYAVMESTADGTVAIGRSALAALTSGAGNVAVGYTALQQNVTGARNLAVGYGAMGLSGGGTCDTSGDNVFIGYNSGGGDWSAGATATNQYNVCIGNYTMDSALAGANYNTALGHNALGGITTGDNNVAIGSLAGIAITTGSSNVLLGYGAGDGFDTEEQNVAIGQNALGAAVNGADACVAIGYGAMFGEATQDGTVAIGKDALAALTSGAGNTAVGYQAMLVHTTGTNNTCLGYQTMDDTDADSNSLGSLSNTFIGQNAGGGTWGAGASNYNCTLGAGTLSGALTAALGNVAIGISAGNNLTGAGGAGQGSYNVLIGYDAQADDANGLNQIVIGKSATGQADNSVTLGNDDVASYYLQGNSGSDLYIGAANDTDTTSSRLFFRKAGGTIASPTVVADDELIGSIVAYGHDGSNYESAAAIVFDVDGEPATGGDTSDMPGRIEFHTTLDGENGLTERMRIDSAGNVTKPTQPAFLVNPASHQTDFAIDSSVTVVFGTEVFDQGSDFASNTFTAPVTGKYQLNVNILMYDAVDSAATYYQLELTTSNRTYYSLIDPDFGQDAGFWTLNLSVLADMDASDTAYVAIRQAGGSQQADVHTASSFSGYLVC